MTPPHTNSGKRSPCPICGRTKDRDCKFSEDIVWCHHGHTNSPPELTVGDTCQGKDGQTWALVDYNPNPKDRWAPISTFKVHQPLDTPAPQAKPKRAKQHREWQYNDRQGNPVITVIRKDDGEGSKDIRQRSNVAGKKPSEVQHLVTPYKYADALQALKDGAPYVFWVEGETCADALWALNLPAITSLRGSGGYDANRDAVDIPPEKLCIVPDRDKVGLKYADKVAANNPGCRWFYPFKGTPEWNGKCPEGGGVDVADWIDAGGTVEQLLAGIQEKPAHGVAAAVSKTQTNKATGDVELLPLSQRIDNRIQELLDAHLSNTPGEIDAAFAELYKLGVARDRAEERILMLWAESHGLDISTGSKPRKQHRGRVLGKAKEGKGLRQQLPGFGLDKDLHLLVSDAGVGKTTAMCELVTVMTARDKGFLDHEAPRSDSPDDKRTTALVIASDGEASAYSMWENYLDTISGLERGANVEIWAQDDDSGESSWNVSLHNMERLMKRMDEGDIAVVVMDTANAILRGAGVNTGVGPVETYLRLLKQIVCRYAPLWISQHTNRGGGTTMKSIGGHPAFQEVPSVVHLIEAKEQADGHIMRVWHVLKLRGCPYRRFSYELSDGELKVTDGHFFENCKEQILVLLHKQILGGGFTSPADLIRISKRPAQSVYGALSELRSLKLIRARGRGYRLTAAGERAIEGLKVAVENDTPEVPDWA